MADASNAMAQRFALGEAWEALSLAEQVEYLKQYPQQQWYDVVFIPTLMLLRKMPLQWDALMAHYRGLGGDALRLERAMDREGQARRPPVDPFEFIDAATMLHKTYPPPRWLVPGLIADGLTLLGGSPKSGKSYLAYALALAVCRAALWCQHWQVEEGPVTFVSLEDDEGDSAQRLHELAPGLRLPAGRLRFVHGMEHVPSFSEGFLGWVEEILTLHTPRLLIIDPISYLYVLKRTGSQFEETKDMLFPLRWLGKKHQCAIVCVDHRRKQSRDDVSIFDTLHGSVAKIAVADSLLMIERDEEEITVAALVRRGKDQTLNLTLSFSDEGEATLAWHGESTQSTQYGHLRQQILTFLASLQSPASVADIIVGCEFVNTKQMKDTIRQILFRSEKTREIARTTRGLYMFVMHAEEAVSRE